MGQILMKKGNEIITVDKAQVDAKKKEGFKVTSKYALKKTSSVTEKK